MHGVAALGQRHGNRGSDGRLADTALAHAHDQSLVAGGDFVDQSSQGRIGHLDLDGLGLTRGGVRGEQCRQGVDPNDVGDLEFHLIQRQ